MYLITALSATHVHCEVSRYCTKQDYDYACTFILVCQLHNSFSLGLRFIKRFSSRGTDADLTSSLKLCVAISIVPYGDDYASLYLGGMPR